MKTIGGRMFMYDIDDITNAVRLVPDCEANQPDTWLVGENVGEQIIRYCQGLSSVELDLHQKEFEFHGIKFKVLDCLEDNECYVVYKKEWKFFR